MARADVFRIRSDKDTHFTGAIAQDAYEEENIPTNAAHKKFAIIAVEVLADQNLDWELWFFSKDGFADADMDLDACIGRVAVAVADQKFYGASGTYYANKELSAPIVYVDDDAPAAEPELHVSLVNRSVTSKNLGATGEVVVIVTCEPLG